MAFPASFHESNDCLGPPAGMSEEQVMSLSIARCVDDDGTPIIVSCWKFTREELDEINATGRIWLGVMGDTIAPSWISGINPFPQPASQGAG